jgi:transcription antitermination factor NusG
VYNKLIPFWGLIFAESGRPKKLAQRNSMNWFALTVKPQHEKSVAEQLAAKALDSYLPLYRAKRRWSDRVKVIELPLFSRYVFCQFGFEDRFKVLQITSVNKIVGFGGQPCPVDDQVIRDLKAVVGSGLPCRPWPFIRIGQRVSICEGPLAGTEGILVREKSGYRVVINVELLNRGVAVEVERDLVRPCKEIFVPQLNRSASFGSFG